MEIERINENTIKFFISYIDIEDRGFDKEDIWYNRERSEQLFWQMMDEVNYKEDFSVEGPLWIQVQAMDKGLEIVVTKAQLSKDGESLELNVDDKTIQSSVEEKVDSVLEEKFGSHQQDGEEEDEEELSFVIQFRDFEDVIQLSHYFEETYGIENRLFHYKDRYMLYVEFDDTILGDDEQEDVLSQILEFGYDSQTTIYRLEEYGKVIFAEDALTNVKQYFPRK
ncbi:adaptor protein MecA [Terribacillus saccharophilus]|jgi:adapter protein MecA 1/2|uniref:adaptor protein MecA n=1 Tax=Terribacillus saccharophilus TaxID=361277 RepID=UPI000BA58419|nr:adaptor protein MecA [Terribacillus saccharophilus]PAF17708.1 adaptor protein MecA [Terribacillus saccharophilus]PAF21444.1 adaptor protein MecA [Terribacillus saccharophilus]PAF38150.1 adaptor protein MecA [Terribacillus saccharophilus]PAF39260.1 adaptor protein MecA [Terribacillus saccharophilus]